MATLTTNGYRYKTLQLSRNEIRLLRLLPTDGNEKLQSIPACHIFHALHERAKSVALSYGWGAATNPRLILVENWGVRVDKILYDAMMLLRPPKGDFVYGLIPPLHQSVG